MPRAVSIIMPAYQVSDYIAAALDSVFAQTFRDFEVIVVNDGCPDTKRLETVLDGYASRITYIKQSNEGVGSARRTAVDAAATPLIAQLDPDDWWEPDYLAVQLRLLETSGVDMIYPNGVYFGRGDLEGRQLMEYSPSDGDVTFANAMAMKANILYSALIRRDAIVRAGNFDPAFRVSEDFDLWMRMLKTGSRISYHREPLLHYRLRADSLTSTPIRTYEWLLRVLNKLEAVLVLTDQERAALEARRTVAQMEMELAQGKASIQQRKWKDALWHFEMYKGYRSSAKLELVLAALRFCPWLIGPCITMRDVLLTKRLIRAKTPGQKLEAA